MRARFQADTNLNHLIVKATLRYEPSIDFATAHAANLAGVEDPEVLALAAQAGRVLVTHDRKIMPTHFAAFMTHTASSGLVVIPQRLPVRAATEDLLLSQITAWCRVKDDMSNANEEVAPNYERPTTP
jgi:hypothetical protein